MMALGAMLAIVCSLGWASADVMRKRLVAGTAPLQLSIRLALTQLVIVVLAAICICMPASIDGWSTWRLEVGYWAYAVPSFVCTAIGHWFFIKALRTSELSLTIPFLSFSPVFVMVVAFVVLGEWPSVLACIGVCVVAIGAVALEGYGARRGREPLTEDERLSYRRGRGLMIATAAVWSCAAALDKGAIRHSSSLTHLTLLMFATWALLSMAQRIGATKSGQSNASQTAHLSGGVGLWLTSGVMVLSLALQFAAYAYWEVAYVESIKRAIGLACSVIFGALIFKEADPWKRLPAVLTMAAGSVCVIMG